ncbi:hypothetical protein BC629DRAFT_558802 [Irpex lacteus]|nr:hypothetical protein BC629DRAFT_558802 [Irpex lacteus]
MYPDFPLRLIASQDYAWAMYLLNVVGDFYRKLPRAEKEDEALTYSIEGSLSTLESEYHSVFLRISQIPHNHVEISMYFFSQVKSSPTSSIESGRTPPIRTRIIGIEMLVNVKSSANDIEPSQFSILDFGLLMKSVQQHPSTCAIILKFWSYKLLKESTTRFPILLKPMGGKTYILAFFHEEGDQAPGLDGDAGVGKWVEVDRSCKPTGKYLDSQSMLEDALRPSR